MWELKISIPGNTETEIWLPVEFSKILINGVKAKIEHSENFAGRKRVMIKLKSGIFTISAKV